MWYSVIGDAMKNIPVFTTENGIASIILEEISFNQSAYIRIQTYSDAKALLKDCVDFCKAAGAEKVYVTGITMGGASSNVIRMSRTREGLGDSAVVLRSVDLSTLELFRSIYNNAMRNIQNASGMTRQKAKDVLDNGSGYFVYLQDEQVGIGIAEGERVHAIVSLKRGMGESIMLALNRVLTGNRVCVEVIDTNLPAMCLYSRMGFSVDEQISKWYKIF